MARAGTVAVNFIGHTEKLRSALRTVEQDVGSLGDKVERFGSKAGELGSKLTRTLTLPILGVGVGAFKMASDLNEAISATDVRFGANSRVVQDWAKNLDSAFGLTRREALDMVTQLRAVTQNSKLTDDQMLLLAERAADVGSQFNMAGTEVGGRFRSALTGSSEVLEQFGVNTKVGSQGMADYARSIGKTVTEMTDAERQAAIYNIIMKETTKAHEDARKTADTAGGQMRVLKADMGRAAEEIGQKLIPAVTGLMEKLSGMVGWLDTTGVGADKVLVALLALAAAGPVLKAIELATKAVAVAQWAWNAAVLGHPLIALTVAIAGLTVQVERTTGGVNGMRDSLRSWLNPMDDVITRLHMWQDLLADVSSKIRNLPGSGVLRSITTLGGRLPFFHSGGVVPGPAGANVPIMAQAGELVIPRHRVAATGGGGSPTYNIYTSSLDPHGAGPIVVQAIKEFERRNGANWRAS